MKTEIIILVLLVLIASFYLSSFTGLFTGMPTTHATRIIDGDTIEVAGDDGPESVRLIGIDTPEKGQFFFEEAKARLEELIGGKEILLETDVTDRDKYGRLLRYVYVNRTDFVNIVLVREGLARALNYPPDDRYEQEIQEAEHAARSQGLGLWQYTSIPNVYCIGIFYFRYNAAGDDRENINDEYVEFRNGCSHAVDMTGWIVEDEASHRFVFPEFVATGKEKFKLYSGSGKNEGNQLYWNSSSPIWNNAGDGMKMWNAEGQLILEYGYKGY